MICRGSLTLLQTKVKPRSHEEAFLAQATDIGHGYVLRYYKNGNVVHLDRAITQFQSVLDRCPSPHPGRSVALSNLATARFIGCQTTGTYLDLDATIGLYQDALDLRPAKHPDHLSTLIDFTIALLTRFHTMRNKADADTAEEFLTAILDNSPHESHEYRSAVNLAAALAMRYQRRGRAQDLDEAIQRGRATVLQTAVGDQRRAPKTNLAIALWTRFEHRGDRRDLDEAIQLHRDALLQLPLGHPDHPSCLVNLGSALATRFESRHDENDLDDSIQHFCDALSRMPVGSSFRLQALNNLASSLCSRFQLRSRDNDINDAIQHHRDALLLMRTGHLDRPVSLTNLANALQTRFKWRGDKDDLEEAIKNCRDALLLRPIGNAYRSASLNNLANALRARFELHDQESDLVEALQHHEEALMLRPVGHPDRFSSLSNLALALRVRFERHGGSNDIDRTLRCCRDMLSLTPPEHPRRVSSLHSLAETLRIRFWWLGNWNDLDEAIRYSRDALLLTPVGSPDSPTSLDILATVLIVRFEKRGDRHDLDEAIQHYRDGLLLRPVGCPDRSISLSNLAAALYRRLEHRGARSDLDEAIQHLRDALLLTPAGSPGYLTSLSNLVVALRTRFERQCDCDGSDLDEAIQRCRDALPLVPVGHPSRSTLLDNLGSALSARPNLDLGGEGTDLDEAIQCYRDAASQKPAKHPNHFIPVNNLANALLTRFKQRGNDNDAHDALQLCHTAQSQTPTNHPSQWAVHSSIDWVHAAELHQHPSTSDAYTKSLQLLDSHIAISGAVQSRHEVMKDFPTDISVNAASCALRRGDVPRALELLEQGRAILWTQIARFRAPLDDLRTRSTRAEMLVKKFGDLSSALDRLGQLAEGSSMQNIPTATADVEARRYQGLVDDWNGVVEELRTFDGFSRFLLPPLFSELQEAACEGPVIILIASRFSCDAIVVLHKQPPVHIRLEITLEELSQLAETHRENISLGRPHYRVLVDVLGELWRKCISPVVAKLEKTITKRSRIWWCPTALFTVFPLHAAAEYREGEILLLRRYISSYTPSLSALVKTRKAQRGPSPVSFAAIGQATPDGQPVQFSPLIFVEPELDVVESHLPLSSIVFKKLTSSESTRREALHVLRDNHWLHLSCHGMQNLAEPFKSFLAMRDGPLSLIDIINIDLSRHEFAFLSACETAMGELATPDEAIHLAAGLQFSGVKSVVGSLWTVGDEVAYKLAAKFYEEFCVDGHMDCTMAARALHKAVAALAKEGVPLGHRITFIHIGI
ncbi:CHAT domain-containing protein [Melanogaster broomeanus]|nr:CHAT domain-containing protein [Melanogaster broomeanus]